MKSDIEERCDIVIPVWNNPEVTRDCVDSITRHTDYPYRLIIVDNASGLPTREYLDSLKSSDDKKVVIIRNEKNAGFGPAVNHGMRVSDAQYLCILNNDTVVTDGWLREMIDIARSNKDVGIVNPSSNTFCQFPKKMDIDTYAGTLKILKGQFQELCNARGFAMLVKREVVNKIGYLDESYGIGYFEDTDYSRRAIKAGYKAVRAKAAYVYHKEGRSFSGVEKKSEMFSENEKKFVSRWGRYLRIAYIAHDSGEGNLAGTVSGNANVLASSGYGIWLFTEPSLKRKLKLIDHENLNVRGYPGIILNIMVLYKVLKRKKKKPFHVILVGNKSVIYDIMAKTSGAAVFSDKDLPDLEKSLRALSMPGSE